MGARLSGLLLLIGGCYSPRLQIGTPCTPALANCPADQQCVLLEGDYVCLDDVPGTDAGATPWSLVQTRGAMGNDVAFTATTAGNLIVVGIETSDNDPLDSLADNANNLYVPIAGARAVNDAEDLGIELWYASRAVAGATRVVATGDTVYAVVMWEVAGLDKVSPLGDVARLDDQASSTSPLGAAITTTSVGEFVVSIAIVGNEVSGTSAGNAFTNDHKTYGNGWAHLTDRQAPIATHRAQWDQPNSAPYCATSAAFRR